MKRKFYKTLHAVTVSALTVTMGYNSQLNASPFHPNEDIEESRKRSRDSDNEQTSTNKRPKISHTEDSERLGRLEYDGFYINVDADDLNDEISTCPLRKQIEKTIKENKISKEDPLRLVIGEGIADDQNSFNAFIAYLRNTKLKDMILSVHEYSKNNIKTIWEGFLSSNRLTSFSAEGFENVTSIGGHFLSNNRLTSFSAQGFENVTSIGHNFLGNNQLTSFSGQGLENVTSIGRFFLSSNYLTSFSAKGFDNLTTIEDYFLAHNQLTSFSAKGFDNLTTIGDCFLSSNYLTSFSAEGLENVTSIEKYFLSFNKNLESIDLTALKNINQLGGYLFSSCPNIKEILVTKEKEKFFKQHINKKHHKKIIVKG